MSQGQKTRERRMEQVEWNGLTWLDIEQPTLEETKYLQSRYPFHALDIDDCLSKSQLPKLDEYDEYFFIILHFPLFNTETKLTTPSQISIFVGENYVVTLHEGKLKPLLTLFGDCQSNVESRKANMDKGPGYLFYRIVDRLVDYCFPIMNQIIVNLEDIEDLAFDERVSVIKQVSTLRRDIISNRRIIWSLRGVIGTVARKTQRFSKKDLSIYWGDVIDHLDKLWSTLDECKEIVEGLKDTDYVLSTERTNKIMRILTVIATAALPFVVVSSIYGMNIRLPLQDHDVAFGIVALITIFISGLLLLFFRKQRWI